MEERPLPPLVAFDGDLTPPTIRRSVSEDEEFLTILQDRIKRHWPISQSSAMARRSLSSIIAKPSSGMGVRSVGGLRARGLTPSYDSSRSNSPSRPGSPDLERPVLNVELPLPSLPMASMDEIAQQIRGHAAEALCALKHHGLSESPSPPPLAVGLDEPGLDLNGRSVWRLQPHNTIKV